MARAIRLGIIKFFLDQIQKYQGKLAVAKVTQKTNALSVTPLTLSAIKDGFVQTGGHRTNGKLPILRRSQTIPNQHGRPDPTLPEPVHRPCSDPIRIQPIMNPSSSVTPCADDRKKKRGRDEEELDATEYESIREQLKQVREEKEKCKKRLGKYKQRLARVKELSSEQEEQAARNKAEWEEKELRYQRKLKVMAKDMERRKKCRGRNQLKTQDRDSYDNANRVIIKNYLRYQIIPHHKFLHKSMRKWTPDDKFSYSGRLAPQLCFPDDVVVEIFYDDKIVPESNKCAIEWRSNVSKDFGKVYKGEWIR